MTTDIDSERDTFARLVRTLEALRDGDLLLSEQLLDDLLRDLWTTIEAHEKAA